MDAVSAVCVKNVKSDVDVSGAHRSPLFHNGPLSQGSHVGECVEHAGESEGLNQFPLVLHLPQHLILIYLFLFAASLVIFPVDSLG